MSEEAKNTPAFKYKAQIEIQSEQYGTFTLRVWKMRDYSALSEFYRSISDPRSFTEQVIHHQIESPGPTIEEIHAWSEDFLRHVAEQWWNLCEQRGRKRIVLDFLNAFRDAVGAKIDAHRAKLMDTFAQFPKTFDLSHDVTKRIREIEPVHAQLSRLNLMQAFVAEDLATRLLKQQEVYTGSAVLKAAEQAHLDWRHQFSPAFLQPVDNSFNYKIIEELEKHSKQLAAIQSPFEALIEQQSRVPALADLGRFSVPGPSELESLMRRHDIHATLASIAPAYEPRLVDIEATMAGIRSPWLDQLHAPESIASIIGLTSVSKAVEHAFDPASSKTLRALLGDFGRTTIPQSAFLDSLQRQSLYIEAGFDQRLTILPEPAFSEALYSSGLLRADLFSPVFPATKRPAEPATTSDKDAILKKRMQEAYDILFTFETELRAYLHETMPQRFGDKWLKHRIPGDMLESWKEKREIAIQKGEKELPLIWYADFSDYVTIIVRKDNWNDFFANTFRNKDEVKVSFQRLQPLRISTMHCRPITKHDLLMLTVEVQSILRSIGKLND